MRSLPICFSCIIRSCANDRKLYLLMGGIRNSSIIFPEVKGLPECSSFEMIFFSLCMSSAIRLVSWARKRRLMSLLSGRMMQAKCLSHSEEKFYSRYWFAWLLWHEWFDRTIRLLLFSRKRYGIWFLLLPYLHDLLY